MKLLILFQYISASYNGGGSSSPSSYDDSREQDVAIVQSLHSDGRILVDNETEEIPIPQVGEPESFSWDLSIVGFH